MTLPAPAGLVPPPDAVGVFCAHLAALLPDSVAVGTRVPDGYNGSQQFVRVDRIGGAMQQPGFWLDLAHLDVEVWGPLEQDAADLIAKCRMYLQLALYTDLSAQGAVVSKVQETVGPQWFSDPDFPPAGHQLVQVAVTLHPAPPTP